MRIETERLVLRPLTVDDTADLHAYQSIPECVRFVPFGVRTPAEVQAAIERHPSQPKLSAVGDLFLLGIELRETGRVVGQLNMSVDALDPKTVEFGYLTHRDYWRRGITREAVTALLTYGFEHEGVERIVAHILVDNAPSISFVEQLGMRREATHIEYERQKGALISAHIYAMLAREWAARRAIEARRT
ncbi:MAG TPA: GNAT family N-acetyltransferase [Microbacteriaceae bacterium]|nr:GNAT family N-acetyltransferase [Microbacteriaceae bacterium]